MREVDPLISNYSHLRGQPREAEALQALQKIASLVKPVMRQRGWCVTTLAEFYPDERNLLGTDIPLFSHSDPANDTRDRRSQLESRTEDMPPSTVSLRHQAIPAHGAGSRHYAPRTQSHRA